jgi:hypothetical protein
VTRARPARKARPSRATVLHLDADVYSEAALERARRAFAELARIEIRSAGRSWLVRMSALAPGVAGRLADEFANHALSCLLVDE